MNKYDSTKDTNEHRWSVRDKMEEMIVNQEHRAWIHDNSKLESPEKELFDEYTPKLKGLTYGSKEYFECLTNLKPALDHHYSVNRHHPEYHPNGVQDMDLCDLVELICDWKAATERHENGSIMKSIKINTERFKLDEVKLSKIFENTIKNMGWET